VAEAKLERIKLHFSTSLKFKVSDYTMFEASSSGSEEWDVSGLTTAEAEALDAERYEHLRGVVSARVAAEAEETMESARRKQ
jgi:hypothetical protein